MDAILPLMGVVLLVLAPIPMILAIERHIPSVEDSDSPLHTWLNRLFLWLMIQMTIAHLLGMSGFLFGSAIVATELLLCLLGLLLTFNTKVRSSSKPVIPKLDPSEKIMLLLLISVWIPVIAYYAMRPFSEHDTIAYHLPTIVTWIQSERFTLYMPFDDQPIAYYPYGWEALCSLFLILGKSDVFVLLCNCAAGILLGLGVFSVARSIGAARYASICATCLLLSMPTFLYNIGTLHTDLPMASFFIISLLYMILLFKCKNCIYLALLATSTSLLCASKASGIAHSALLLAGFLLFFVPYRFQIRHNFNRTCMVLVFISACIAISTGGYWLIRNWLSIGNPLGFLDVRIGPFIIFSGPMNADFIRRTSLAGLFSFYEREHLRILASSAYHYLHLPFLGLAFFLTLSFMQSAHLHKKTIIIVILLIATTVIYWHSPFSADNGAYQGRITPFIGDAMRYAFPAFAMLAICAALVCIPSHLQRFILCLISIFMILALLHAGGRKFCLATCLTFFMLTAFAKARVLKRFFITILLFGIIATLSIRADNTADTYKDIFEFVESIPNAEHIGYMLGYQAYPLYGPEWRQKVEFIHEGKCLNINTLHEILRRKGIRYLAVGPVMGIFSDAKEVNWINSDTRFMPVLGKDPLKEMVIYQIDVAANPATQSLSESLGRN